MENLEAQTNYDENSYSYSDSEEKSANFSFTSDEFTSEIIKLLNNNFNDFESLFNSIHVTSLNQKYKSDEFLAFLKSLDSNKLLDNNATFKLVTHLNRDTGSTNIIESSNLKQILLNGLLSYYNKSKDKALTLTILDLTLSGKLGSIRHIKSRKLDSLVENTKKKIRSIKDFNTDLINLFHANEKKFDFIYFFSKLMNSQSIERIVINYFESELLDDSEMDKNLYKARLIVPSFKNLSNPNLIYELIFPRCESLLLRTSKNYKFLDVIFTNLEMKYTDDFIHNLFKYFGDYFFSQDKVVVESSINSFTQIVRQSNRKILLNNLLNLEFSADKIELNILISHYLVLLLTLINNKKTQNETFNNKEVLEIVFYCLKRIQLVNENNKLRIESILESLVFRLYDNNLSENVVEIDEKLNEDINNQIKKILSSSNYSNFFGFIYNIIISVTNLGLKLNSDIKTLCINNAKALKDTFLSSSNKRNNLSLLSTCFFLMGENYLKNSDNIINDDSANLTDNKGKANSGSGSNNKNKNNNKNNSSYGKSNKNNHTSSNSKSNSTDDYSILLDAIRTSLIPVDSIGSTGNSISNSDSETGFIYKEQNFLNFTSFDFINILNVYKQIAINKNLEDKFEEESPMIASLVSHLMFRKNKENHEEQFFLRFLKQVETRKFFDYIMNSLFDFIVNFFSSYGESKTLHKFSFHKMRNFLKEYVNKFYTDLFNSNNTISVKFLILLHDDEKMVKKVYDKYSGVEINTPISILIENNYETISKFIFSELGILNKHNTFVIKASYSLLKKMVEMTRDGEFKLASQVAKDAFIRLNYKKLLYIDSLTDYYHAQVDYISFYDLEFLIESLKQVVKDYDESLIANKNSFCSNNNIANNTASNKKKKQVTPGNKNPSKVDKETKLKEYKSFLDSYLIMLRNQANLLFSRINPVMNFFNNSAEATEGTEGTNKHKNIMKDILNHMWSFLSVKSINSVLLINLKNFFKENTLTHKMAHEISNLMFFEVNPGLFNPETDANLVISFNEKLRLIMDNEKERTILFDHFDFILIKLLFFIILNGNISNEDKTTSVDILIKIIDSLPQEILNFNDISMLATCILKTSYNDDNLDTLLKIFLERCKEDHFLILCEDLLSYEYVAKVTLLKKILMFDTNIDNNNNNANISSNFRDSLRKYKNLVYKIWILIFDENENISELAKDIWNQFNLYLDAHFVYSDEFSLAFTQHRLKDSINRSIRAFAFLVKSEIKIILNKFQGFYEEEINEINEIGEIGENGEETKLMPKLRTFLFDFVNETVELFSSEMKSELLDFLMRVSDSEKDDEIFDLMNKTIFLIIKSIQEEDLIRTILSSIEKNIKSILTKNLDSLNYNNLKIILMMLKSVLMTTLENNLDKSSLYDSLFTLSLKVKNSEVLCLISSCYQFLAKDNLHKSQNLFTKILDNIANSKDKLVNQGEIYILAGLLKCFGIKNYKSALDSQKPSIHYLVSENMKKAKTIYEKQNAMIVIKVFAETLKRLYEPYLVEAFDQICELIADREDIVREATQAGIKSFMKELSGFGVKSIMPRLIKDLHSMNWRSKVVNIEILGQFAFCAPKQLSIYIPKVIKEIMQVFKDPHQKVQECAIRVLKDISSVIKNPEIVELSSLLIDAVANSYEHSKNALTALLETDFKHAIDPPSLALIIPIIDYNLKVQSENLKKMSAHLIGSIANLIRNPLDIYQYIDIIIPNLKVALFDSIPECRNAMAKAIGSLTKSLGANYLKEMLRWVKDFLEKECDTVQRSGAAQAYAEMMVAFGDSFIDKHIVEVISKIQESNHIGKEGYLSIFVFLPGCLGEKFEKYFELIFPLIIEAFSDDHENVRNVSNKIFEICIKLFAKRNTNQLVEPLLLRLFDENWRIRNSSIALIKTLIANLNKEFFKESSTFFSKEQRDEVLVSTFILKADNSGNTSTIANMIWRDYVDNIPKYLSKVLKQIYEELMRLLSSDKDECFDIAEGCIKMLVTKFSDKFFMELLPVIKETIAERHDNENNVYASFYIFQLAVSEASEKLLSNYRERFMRIVNDNIHTPFSSVRKLLASIVFEISKKFDDYNTNKSFIHNLMKGARGKDFEEQRNMLEIVGNLVDISKGQVMNYVINEIFRKPYEEGFISLASMISDDIAENMKSELKEVYVNLFEAANFHPKTSIEAIVSISVRLEEESLPIFVDVLEKLFNKLESTSTTTINQNLPVYLSEIVCKFVENSQQDLTNVNEKLMEIGTALLFFNDNQIVKNFGETVKILLEKSEKEDCEKLLKAFMERIAGIEVKLNLENLQDSDVYSILSEKFKLIMDSLLLLVQNGLLYSEDKIAACTFVDKVLAYTSRQTMKTYIMKMTGPLIRILSEKFSAEIKERVLDNIKNLIIKSREDVKGISPQLQSVFVKTLTDSSQIHSERCQLKAGENILRLLQFYPRADVIVNDLMKSLISKYEREEFMLTIIETEILADIVRFYGSSLKPNIVNDNYVKLVNILNSRRDLPYDYLVTLLTAFTKYSTNTNIEITEEMPKKLFDFLNVFNGNLTHFQTNKKSAFKAIQSLPKDQSVILVKTLGKIINKYKYFLDFDSTNFEVLLKEYETLIQMIILDTDLFLSSNNILDGNLCVFILSLGYMNEYSSNIKLFRKIFNFLVSLISQAKVNSQLLVNCLSLILLKEIKPNPDSASLIYELRNLDVEDREVEIIDGFLKKVYYLYKEN